MKACTANILPMVAGTILTCTTAPPITTAAAAAATVAEAVSRVFRKRLKKLRRGVLSLLKKITMPPAVTMFKVLKLTLTYA